MMFRHHVENHMEYGVIYYKDTDNIGDDIQAYAVMQFLPHVDFLIDRENMSSFHNDSPVAVIMNGWFLHNKGNWPPSKCLYPLCISMHFTKNDYMGIGYKYLDGIGGDYLRAFQPIGCRDQSTYDCLKERNINVYLSGCVTLTLPQREKKGNGNPYVCLVDVPDGIEERTAQILKGSSITIKKTTHWVDYKTKPLEWKQRIEKVEELLDIYQNAKCVITKRLHCALPCLALGTPVLLLLDNETDDITRYSHFTDLLYVSTTNDFLTEKTIYDILNPPHNKDRYLRDRELVINKIREFIHNIQESPNIPSEWNTDDSIIMNWQRELMTNASVYAAQQVDSLLRTQGITEKNHFEQMQAFSNRYNQDISVMKEYIDDNQTEILRLNNVIKEKESEENRLNAIIREKESEISRLNSVIKDKENEENRLNSVIYDKENEENRLNSVIQDKEDEENRLNSIIREKETEESRLSTLVLSQTAELEQQKELLLSKQEIISDVSSYIDQMNIYSLMWALFFSKQFASKRFSDKMITLLEILKRKIKQSQDKRYLEDIITKERTEE